MDAQNSYAWRFQDPAFVDLHKRWTESQHAWRKYWEKNLPIPGLDVFNPDVSLLSEQTGKELATKYMNTRAEYHADIRRRLKHESEHE